MCVSAHGTQREAMAEEEAAAAVNDPERAAARALKETADEQVFMQSYIPRSLQEIDVRVSTRRCWIVCY